MDPMISVEVKPLKGFRSSWSIQRATDNAWLCKDRLATGDIFLGPTTQNFKRRRRFKQQAEAEDYIMKLNQKAIKEMLRTSVRK